MFTLILDGNKTILTKPSWGKASTVASDDQKALYITKRKPLTSRQRNINGAYHEHLFMFSAATYLGTNQRRTQAATQL